MMSEQSKIYQVYVESTTPAHDTALKLIFGPTDPIGASTSPDTSNKQDNAKRISSGGHLFGHDPEDSDDIDGFITPSEWIELSPAKQHEYIKGKNDNLSRMFRQSGALKYVTPDFAWEVISKYAPVFAKRIAQSAKYNDAE